MARYGLVIALDTGRLVQIDHDTGAWVRNYGALNETWAGNVSDFDPTTGLPTPEALGATDTSNPCGTTATSALAYLLDPSTCRVLAFDPLTGDLYATFGGRRGIGSGKITPDPTRRSIIALANGKIWVTDNAGDFLVQFATGGTFEADHAISGWATALSLAFDQCTGFAFDVARQRYWALVGATATTYLIELDTSLVPTGTVIDLTTRLASSLGITVSGHGGSDLGRAQTRGLFFHNGYLCLTSTTYVVKVDLTNSSGDQLLKTFAQDVGPGAWASDGTEFSFVGRDQVDGQPVVHVLTVATLAERTYGFQVTVDDGDPTHVAAPWDLTVSPNVEDPSTRTSRDLQVRARIQATATRGIQLRASIRNTVPRTLDARARILQGAIQQLTMRARIVEATTLLDRMTTAWTLEDSVGSFSRGLTLSCAANPGLAVGDTVTLYAGYNDPVDGPTLVKVFHGEVDDVTVAEEADSALYTFTLRDVGAKEANSRRVTRTTQTQFPRTTTDVPSVNANNALLDHGILNLPDFEAGVGAGAPAFSFYGNFTARDVSPIQVLQQLTEPWNLFASNQYYPTVRDGRTFSQHINWANPPADGYRLPRARLTSQVLKQQRYIESPNLVGLAIQVRGATFTLQIIDQLGPQTRIEYMRSLAQSDVTTPSASNIGTTAFATEYVLTETSNVEETWGDKVLSRTSETYESRFTSTDGGGGGTKLIHREVEANLYFEPPGDLGFDSIQTSSAGPSPLALPLQVNSIVSGIDPTDSVFRELQRTQTNYYYDAKNNLAAESTSVTLFDSSTNTWKLDSVQQRFHSETTGGSTRTRRLSFANDDGTLTFDTADGQQVGGRRPNPALISGLASVVTSQAMFPIPDIVVDFLGSHVSLPVATPTWLYENPLLGQDDCETVYSLAVTEQGLQANPLVRWETIDFAGPFDPNLQSGMALQLERQPGVWVDYWVESVAHSYTADEALSRGSAKRITTDPLPA
jgi:hypothetical protein